MILPRCAPPLRCLALVLVAIVLVACGGAAAEPTPASTAPPLVVLPTLAPTATFEPGHEPLAVIDVEQVAAETGCPMTPYTSARFLSNGEAAIWHESDGLRVAPYAWAGRWYAGVTPLSWRDHEGGPLFVTATRRDGGETVEQRDHINPVWQLFNRLTLPEPGCWDISATVADRSLAFTIYAYPLNERPDIAELLAERAELIPYPVPADCAVTPLEGPLDDAGAAAHLAWWVTGDGLRLEGELDLLYESDNVLRFYPQEWGAAVVTAVSLDDPTIEAVISEPARRSDFSGEHAAIDLFLPIPGCWQIEGTVDGQSVEATLYAYPAACRPTPGLPTPATCRDE